MKEMNACHSLCLTSNATALLTWMSFDYVSIRLELISPSLPSHSLCPSVF